MNKKQFIKYSTRFAVIIIAASLGWFLYKPEYYNITCPRCEHNVVFNIRTTHNNCENCGYLFPMKLNDKGNLTLDTIEYTSNKNYYGKEKENH